MSEDTINAERRRELGLFLCSRRARLRPADVGLSHGTGHRRVVGLRREEVAVLAGVGARWYTMLENGTANGVSAATLDGVARALLLTNDEADYIHNLADQSMEEPPKNVAAPLVLAALAAIELAPAYVCTAQWMVLDWNYAMTVVWNIEPPGAQPFNIVRRMFADDHMRSLHGNDFADFARQLVAMVRVGAGILVNDPVYRDLYTDLHQDPIFAAAWDNYDVAAPFGSFRTRIVSPAVGEFIYEVLSLPLRGDAGQSIVIQVPEKHSADRLRAALAERRGT